MNAFESLVAGLLEREGFWVRSSFKVELTKAEKREIGRHSSPRWELDLIAYRARDNELRIVECKSLLDSSGVHSRDFNTTGGYNAKRYKLFNSRKLLGVVARRLKIQLIRTGACRPKPSVRLCLAAGHVTSDKELERMREFFSRKGWILLDPGWIKDRLTHMAGTGYDDNISAVVAKILTRNPD